MTCYYLLPEFDGTVPYGPMDGARCLFIEELAKVVAVVEEPLPAPRFETKVFEFLACELEV